MSGISLPALPVAVPVTPAGTTATVGDAGTESGEFASLMAGLLGKDAPTADLTVHAAVETPLDPVTPSEPPVVDPALLVASGAPVATPTPGAPPVPVTVDTKDPKSPTPPLPTPGPIERTGPVGPGSRPVDDGGEVTRAYGSTTGVVIKGPHQPPINAPAAPPAPPAQTTSTAPDTPAGPDTPANPDNPAGLDDARPTAPTAPPAPTTPTAPDTTDATGYAPPTVTPADSVAPAPAGDGVADTAPAVAVAQPVVPTAGTQVLPGAPIAAAGPSAPVHGGPSHIPDQVTAQVFPEIGRLAVRASSAGEGIHRITLNLHPDTLGDVRVTLVVRGGEMKISIHAANEAGRIMADSIPELRRLLGSAGADAIVAVRDTGAGGATMNTADQGSSRSDLDRSGYDAHQQGRDTHGRDARTRDGHIATDGSNSGAQGTSPGPPDQVRATRLAGVDVTV